jgi:cellulose synthase/poly-beta-1,6-N-acetylglucosamine synthase-like glycosyltransferase
MIDVVRHALVILGWGALGYFLLVNGVLSVLLISAAVELRRNRLEAWHEARWRVLGSEVAPTITMIAPAYNENVTVSASVSSLLTLGYSQLEVVVVNDGSTDDTQAVLERDFELVPVHPIYRRRIDTAPVRGIYRSRRTPRLVVVDKENGGKADALNAGLNVAAGELVCAIDADTVIETDALVRMVRPFLADPRVAAAGGTILAVNGCTVRHGRVVGQRAPGGFLAGVQAVEYLRAFVVGRLGWNRLGGNLVVSGAFGMFRRQAALDAGGYLRGTVGEDVELVARIRRRARERGEPERVVFIPDPVAWTEVPESLTALGRQRDRWHRGLAETLARHRRVLLNRRFGALGLVVLPYYLGIELLAPVVETLGVLSLVAGVAVGAVNLYFVALLLLVAYGFALVLTACTLLLEEWTYRAYGSLGCRVRLLAFAVAEQLGYRQLTVIWRLHGLLGWALRRRGWGTMARKGFGGEALDRLTDGGPGPP